MRNAFISTLLNYNGDDLFLLTGDLGFSVLEKFQNKWPEQFINVGVAEQNMTGIAAGLAMEGYKVFTYSIANFNTLRCLEQLRNDICYNNLDVTIVSVGGGFQYGSAGYSHHAIQDIAIMGSLPNITLLLPSDPYETEWCVNYALRNKEPKYLRIGKNGESRCYNSADEIGGINKLQSIINSNIAIIATGGMLSAAVDVCNSLKTDGIKCDLYSIPIINPSYSDQLKNKLNSYEYIFILEEHIKDIGLAAIINSIVRMNLIKVISFGLDKNKCYDVGNQNYLRNLHKIDVNSIILQVKSIVTR